MGIKGLGILINQCEGAKGIIYYKYMKGKKVAVDVSILENRNLYGASQNRYKKAGDEDEEIDEGQIEIKFLSLCVEFAINLMMYGILPIFVFDGKRRPEKQDTSEKRKESREKTKQKIIELEKK